MTMGIGFGRPKNIVWTVSGAGASIVDGAANLTDDLPDTTAALTWVSGTQTTASKLRLRGDWTGGIKPGLAGFTNIQLPVGTKIEVAFRRATDPVNTYPLTLTSRNAGNIQRIFQGPRGERTALHLFEQHNATNVVGVEFIISNDVNGVASIAASAPWWSGEAIVCPVTYLEIEAEWTPTPVDTTMANYSVDRQPYTDPGLVYHTLQFRLPADSQGNYFGDPNDANAIDYESLIAKLDRGQSAIYIPRYVDEDGNFSAHMLHRTAKMGRMTKLPAPTHRNGPYFDSSPITVQETPIPT